MNDNQPPCYECILYAMCKSRIYSYLTETIENYQNSISGHIYSPSGFPDDDEDEPKDDFGRFRNFHEHIISFVSSEIRCYLTEECKLLNEYFKETDFPRPIIKDTEIDEHDWENNVRIFSIFCSEKLLIDFDPYPFSRLKEMDKERIKNKKERIEYLKRPLLQEIKCNTHFSFNIIKTRIIKKARNLRFLNAPGTLGQQPYPNIIYDRSKIEDE